MKRAALFLACALCFAQEPFTENFIQRYSEVKRNLLDAAAAMPEEHYQFKPTPAQRTFAEWIGHTVILNVNQCATAKGVAPLGMDHSRHGASAKKVELMRSLSDSFQYCDAVWEEMTDRRALSEVTIKGRRTYPVSSMLSLLANLNSHYGNLVGYMRVKEIVPPSTARARKK